MSSLDLVNDCEGLPQLLDHSASRCDDRHEYSELTQELTHLELASVPKAHQDLLEQLAQFQQLDQERRTRIHHLEKALDQAIACLGELRAQIHDQHFLETQLANTEEYSSVQQQAIARLKFQLAEQQQQLDAQILETQQRDQAIQELLVTIENMTQGQQREVERLRSRLAQDQVEVQTHRSQLGKQLYDLQGVLEARQQRVGELESEILAARTLGSRLRNQLETAQQQIKDLSTRVLQHRSQRSLETPGEPHSLLRSVPPTHSAPIDSGATTIEHSGSSTWLKTPQQVDALEKRLGLQLAQQARWQQQQHDLESDRERLQTRVTDMEQQVAEMQEQILRQAQQETEYETAVQYWKDRHLTHQHQNSHLKTLTEQLLAANPQDANPLLIELLHALTALYSERSEKPSTPLPRLTTVELPEFLVRRRAAQKNMATELPNPLNPLL